MHWEDLVKGKRVKRVVETKDGSNETVTLFFEDGTQFFVSVGLKKGPGGDFSGPRALASACVSVNGQRIIDR